MFNFDIKPYLLSLTLVFAACTNVTPQVDMLSLGVNHAKIENGLLGLRGSSVPMASEMDIIDDQGSVFKLKESHSRDGYRFFESKTPGLSIKAGVIYSILIKGAKASSPIPIVFESSESSLPRGGSEGQVLSVNGGVVRWIDLPSVDYQTVVFKSDLRSCGVGESLKFNSVANSFSCEKIVVGAADVVGVSPVAISGSYSDLVDKPTIPSKLSELVNDNGTLTANSWISSTKISGAIASSISTNGIVNFSSFNTVTLTNTVSGVIDVVGLRKGGSYTIIIEILPSFTYSINSTECADIKYLSHIYASEKFSILSILVSDSGVCYVSFRTGI